MATAPSSTFAAVERYQTLFDQFEREHPASPWLARKRRAAIERVAALGFPTRRHEEWKYTDIAEAANFALSPLFKGETAAHEEVRAANLPFGALPGHRLVFVDGHYAPELSILTDLPEGVEVVNLATALANHSEVAQESLGRIVDAEGEVFAALNTAFAQDGAFVRVPSGIAVEAPVILLFVTSREGATITNPRNLILLGANSSLHVVEIYASTGEGQYLTNTVTEIVTGPNSQFEHIKVQNESPAAYHVGTTQLLAGRDAVANAHTVNFGGHLARNNGNAVMNGSGATVTLNGLVVGRDDQLVDNHTVMDHAQPHCTSHEMYAHVMDDRSTAVFNGKIFVRLDAQKTDAKQSNRSLLLSPNATINTKPQLEIFADDVKCTHGATVGQLDEEALFYLRARGIPARAARNILIRAFANEILESFSIDALRDELEELLVARLATD